MSTPPATVSSDNIHLESITSPTEQTDSPLLKPDDTMGFNDAKVEEDRTGDALSRQVALVCPLQSDWSLCLSGANVVLVDCSFCTCLLLL